MAKDEHDDKHMEECPPGLDYARMNKKKSPHPEMGEHPLYRAPKTKE